MPKVSPIQSNFTAGELSPLAYGRTDLPQYKAGLETCLNNIPLLQGPVMRRPGTKFVAETKEQNLNYKVRLIPFQFSTTQAYIVEIGADATSSGSGGYCRFYKDNAQILLTAQNITGVTNANPAVVTYAGADTFATDDEVYITGVAGALGNYLNGRNFRVGTVNTGANTFQLKYLNGTNVDSTTWGAWTSGGTVAEVYTIATPWAGADLERLSFAQSADTLYICHEDYAPRKLTRTSHTSWTLTAVDFQDGPYLNVDTSGITISWTGIGVGAKTATASSALFSLDMVGRHIRVQYAGKWEWGRISAYTSTTVVTVTFVTNYVAAGAVTSTAFRLGTWWDAATNPATPLFPACVTFHENRLCMAGGGTYPQRFDCSTSGDYETFSPSLYDGTVRDSDAVSFTLNTADSNSVLWLESDEKGMIAGTSSGEFVVRPSAQTEPITPTNISGKRATAFGSRIDVAAVKAGKSVMFVQRAGRKLREFVYFYDVDGYRAVDLSLLSEHITKGGITGLAYQDEPQSIVWMVRADGTLAAMTYERESDTSFRAGWSRNILGGASDTAGTQAIVESVAVSTASDGLREEVWMIVKRRINGVTRRYVEYMTQFFDDGVEQKDAYFVDGGLTYDQPITISGATKANPVVVTATAHGLSNGDKILISDVVGMTELNGHSFVIANKTANTFELTAEDGGSGNVNGTAFTTYISGGKARKYVSTVTGLWHLEGETVDVMADGQDRGTATVTNGSITLNPSGTTIHVGYSYTSRGKMLRLDAGAADGTSIGKTRRSHQVGFMLYRTLGFKFGTDFDNLEEMVFETESDVSDRAVPFFTGIRVETLEADYDYENQICWQQDRPFPGTVLSIFPQMITQDRG
jgi:hypothetical protein